MYIKRLEIKNFRGIKNLKWDLPEGLVCLIGNGDSCKTTILNAIELSLLHHWNFNIQDTDFYNCDFSNNIEIITTIGDVPTELLTIEKFGTYIRKNVDLGTENDEPENEEYYLTIKLEITSDFEPEWSVINNRMEKKSISHRDRAKLHLYRIGENFDKDFSLGRNSILNLYMENKEDINHQIIDILKRHKSENIENEEIKKSLEKMSNILDDYNISREEQLNLILQISSGTINISNLNLCDGKIPVSKKGIGTQRLISSTLNLGVSSKDSSIMIDEVEYGLEPYRLSDLLTKLIENSAKRTILLTSHSTIPLTELEYNNILLCSNDNGYISCKSIPKDMENLLRSSSYAFLSKKILSVEGATEYGILKELNHLWSKEDKSLSYYNSLVLDGKGGSKAVKTSLSFLDLGYYSGLFIDSDNAEANKEGEEAKKKGVKLFTWNNNVDIETRIVNDVPFILLKEIINIVVELVNNESAISRFEMKFGKKTIDFEELNKDISEDEFRKKLIEVLVYKKDKDKGLKSVKYGRLLGKFIVENMDKINEESELLKTINDIKKWYSNEQ